MRKCQFDDSAPDLKHQGFTQRKMFVKIPSTCHNALLTICEHFIGRRLMFPGSDLKRKRWAPELTASDAAWRRTRESIFFCDKRSKKRQLAKMRNGDGLRSVAI
jgi:hypothetical protein